MGERLYSRCTGLLALCLLLLLQLCAGPVLASSVSLQSICPGAAEQHDQKGNISSPSYPSNYPPALNCKWHIYHEANEVVTISFYGMDITDKVGSQCGSDFLTIADKRPTIYCGDQIPIPFISPVSTYNRLTIVFQTDNQNAGRGFKFMYYRGLAVAEYCDAKTEFHCKNLKCIPREWLCNGMDECGDRSDEAVNTCHSGGTVPAISPTTWDCPSHTMYCLRKDGMPQCLPEDKKCDGNVDCANGADEMGCEVKCKHDLQQSYGSFSSPNYPNTYPDRLNCTWSVFVGEGAIVQLRFKFFELEVGIQTDYVTVYDGSSSSSKIIETYYGYKSTGNPATSTHFPPAVIEGSGSRLYINFVSDSNTGNSGFNATFQTKGLCIDDQKSCSDASNAADCYAPDQQCDGELTCLQGNDELGCSGCKDSEIPCDPQQLTVKCYTQLERCNGQARCSGKEDELGCSSHLCNASVGLFLCGTYRCIQESWWCDTNFDCDDNSDEMNCPMSTKVITAAVVGSIVCGLLLVAALSCTCKLYQLYHSDPNMPTHSSPLSEIEDELMRREAPPSYTATMASPHFDDAQRAFIESLQAAAQARQDGRERGASNQSARSRPQQNGQVPSSSPSATDGAANSAQDANATNNASAANSGDASQQNEAPLRESETLNADDNSSPYTEIEEPNQVGDVSSYTTDTDSDTNAAEAEMESRDRRIVRAATNIRRMRLAGGVQNIVDSVANRQREDQRNSSEDSRRRSSGGLQSIMERITRSRESRSRQDATQAGQEEEEEETSLSDEPLTDSTDTLGGTSGADPVDSCLPEQQNTLNSLSASDLQERERDGDDDDSSRDSLPASNPAAPGHVPEVLSSNQSSSSQPSAVEDRGEALSSEDVSNDPPSPTHLRASSSDDDAPLDLEAADAEDSTLIDDEDVPLVSS